MARRCGACRTVLYYVVKAWFVASVAQTFATLCLDNWLWEPRTTCQGPGLPVNQSGLKVMVRGMAKTGTKSITKALADVGLKTYHSGDFFAHVWTPLSDEYWRRPENGGCLLQTFRCPRPKWDDEGKHNNAVIVLNNTAPARIAAGLAKCGAEAMAFDSIDRLWGPIFETSPNVKVISMSWRTYEQYKKSRDVFDYKLSAVFWTFGLLVCAPSMLPYQVILMPLADYLSGGAITETLAAGGDGMNNASKSVFKLWYRQSVRVRRWLLHAIGGLELQYNREEYEEYFEEVRRAVPKDRLLEWDMKRSKMKDLCNFLEIKDNPVCDTPGPLPRIDEFLLIQKAVPTATLQCMCVYLFIHFLNWQVLNFIFGVFPCCPCLFESRRKKSKKGKEE